MRTTFLNGDNELKIRGKKYFKSRIEDLTKFMNDPEKSFDDIGTFNDYGLCVDYVEPGTFKNKRGYVRYQLSWGGPSDEFRFYSQDKIEYVFLDWGVGVGFDVTTHPVAEWLYNEFSYVEPAKTKNNDKY